MAMETAKSRAWWIVLALVLLLVLLAAPAIGWLTRAQLMAQLTPPSEMLTLLRNMGVQNGLPPDRAEARERYEALRTLAARQPSDLTLQLAFALTPAPDVGNMTAERLTKLRALELRFPDHPDLYAHALRYATIGEIHLRREAEFASVAGAPTGRLPDSPQTTEPEVLAAFDRDAAAGERLDPDNAFFPLMHAMGLFTAKRDAEALAALHRAAEKPRYEDYVNEETETLLRVEARIHGRQTALQRLPIQAAILYPHYAQMRAVARTASYMAIQREQAGRAEAGFAIRRDLRRCGSLMRVQSRPLIGSLVGIAIAAIATARPGGRLYAPPPPNRTLEQSRQAQEQRQKDYLAYLMTIGHPEEAQAVRAEFAADKQAREIIEHGIEVGPMGGQAYARLMAWWVFDLIVFSNALRLLLLAMVAWLLARFRQIEDTAAPLIIGFLLLALALYSPHAEWGRAMRMLTQVMQNLSGGPASSAAATVAGNPTAAYFAVVVFSLAFPVTLVVALGMVSLVRREPFARRLLRGLQGVGAALACLLLLVYAGMGWTTVRQENALTAGMNQALQHEGRYYAQLQGKTWPGLPNP